MSALMDAFDHEKLDVYQASVEFLVVADTVAASLPRGRAYIADQLRRSATSIAYNIAEGAGELAPADKVRSTGWPADRRRKLRPSSTVAGISR
jgi:hypothetical protein